MRREQHREKQHEGAFSLASVSRFLDEGAVDAEDAVTENLSLRAACTLPLELLPSEDGRVGHGPQVDRQRISHMRRCARLEFCQPTPPSSLECARSARIGVERQEDARDCRVEVALIIKGRSATQGSSAKKPEHLEE